MKRLVFAGLTTLVLATVIGPTTKADPTTFNPYAETSDPVTQLAPSELVSLAHRGYLKDQGIPEYQVLSSEYISGHVESHELVKAAVNSDLLPASAVDDQGYLNAVDSQLQLQLKVH